MRRDGRSTRIARACVCVCVALAFAFAGLGAGAPPAGATSPAARIARAQALLSTLAAQIRAEAATLQNAKVELVRADAQTTVATYRLAMLQDARRRLDEAMVAAADRAAAARAQLNDAAAEAFMSASSGTVDGDVVVAVLEAGSLTELSDRVEYTAAASGDLAAVSREAALAQAELAARQLYLDGVLTAQRAAVGARTDAHDRAFAAVASAAAAQASLDNSRSRVVTLISRLQRQLGGIGRVDVSGVVGALQGAQAVSYGRWAALLLRVLRAPACRDNLVAVVSWEVAESTQAAWNPLATTHRMDGATDFNAVGVQSYASLGQGLQATADTLSFGWEVYGYGAIVGSLRNCAPAQDTARAINASRWCAGCAGGGYVVNVVPRVDADLESYLRL